MTRDEQCCARASASNMSLLLRQPLTFAWRYRWPMLVLLVGSGLDAWTTWRNVSWLGTAAEVHPAQKLFWDVLGVSPLTVVLAKCCQLAFLLPVSAIRTRFTPWLIIVAGVLYMLAAVSNYFLLL